MNKSGYKTSFFLASRGITQGSRGSLYLTVLIIAMVFINMIFMPSIIMGFIKTYEDQFIAYNIGNILVSPKTDDEYIEDIDELLEKINSVPGVSRAAGHYSTGGTLHYKGYSLGTTIEVIKPNDERLVTDIYKKIKDGDYLGEGETGQIIMGIQVSGHKDTAEDMGPTLGYLNSGDSVTVDFTNGVTRELRVKGIIETGSFMTDQGVYITWDEMESVLGHPITEGSNVIIKTDPDADEAAVKTQILRFGVAEKVQTWQDLLDEAMGRAIADYAMLNSITIVVSLIIAVVVLFIVIMIKTLSSRRQIGVLKAIGLEKGIIIYNYVFQVLIMTTLGVILGVFVLEAMVAILTAFPFQFSDGTVTPVVMTADLVNNTILLFIVGFFAGYIPAWRVASEDIMIAMRA